MKLKHEKTKFVRSIERRTRYDSEEWLCDTYRRDFVLIEVKPETRVVLPTDTVGLIEMAREPKYED